jgi:hypothetical protein
MLSISATWYCMVARTGFTDYHVISSFSHEYDSTSRLIVSGQKLLLRNADRSSQFETK